LRYGRSSVGFEIWRKRCRAGERRKQCRIIGIEEEVWGDGVEEGMKGWRGGGVQIGRG
jgi:hypothetical protein